MLCPLTCTRVLLWRGVCACDEHLSLLQAFHMPVRTVSRLWHEQPHVLEPFFLVWVVLMLACEPFL